MHVQSVQNYCFSLSNMQIYDVLVAVVVVRFNSLFAHSMVTILQLLLFDRILSCWQITLKVERKDRRRI